MNYKNLEKRENSGIPAGEKIGFSEYAPENENLRENAEDDFYTFLEIYRILAVQEYRKKRFFKILKISISAILAVLAFSGIFIFAKKHKAGKSEKMKKVKV